MRARLLLGPVLILLLVLLFGLDQQLGAAKAAPPGAVLFPLAALLCIGAALELAAMHRGAAGGTRTLVVLAALAGLSVATFGRSTPHGLAIGQTVGALVVLASFANHARRRASDGALADAGAALLGYAYLGVMLGLLLSVRMERTAWTLLWVLLVTKSSDIGAYFAGKAFGRHKLIPWLSPGKTWEGLGGGLVLAAVIGLGGVAALGAEHTLARPLYGALAGLALGAAGQLGDLLVSLFKRDAGIKDSGDRLPGFGGVLDVLDSPLLIAPIAYWWLAA